MLCELCAQASHSFTGSRAEDTRVVGTNRTVVAELEEGSVQPHVAAKPTRTRWWMLVLFSLMYLICYLDRGIISVAQPEIAKQFGLSKSSMGLVLAAFTWAYALGQVPAGWFGDRFGPIRAKLGHNPLNCPQRTCIPLCHDLFV